MSKKKSLLFVLEHVFSFFFFFFFFKAQSVRLVPVNHVLLVVLFAAWLDLLFLKENTS